MLRQIYLQAGSRLPRRKQVTTTERAVLNNCYQTFSVLYLAGYVFILYPQMFFYEMGDDQ